MPGRSQVSDLDVLSDADRSALDWISKQLGSARIRRLIILVAGLSNAKWEAADLHQFVSHQAELTRSCNSAIRANGGILAQSPLTGAIGYWPCLGIGQWNSSALAAKKILRASDRLSGVSVCLAVGTVLSTPIEIQDEVRQQLTGPLIHDALCQRLSVPAGVVRCTAKFEDFAVDWESSDSSWTSSERADQAIPNKNRKIETPLARRAWAACPVQLAAAVDKTLVQLNELAVVLEAASVLGQRFQPRELAIVLDMCPAALQSLLDHPSLGRTLRCKIKPGGAVEYHFDEPQLCDAAYSRLPNQVIERLHRRAADVIANRQTKAKLTPFDCREIADHCERSGDHLRASSWWLHAGQEAIKRDLTNTAISSFESAGVGSHLAMSPISESQRLRASHLLASQVASIEGYASSDTRLGHLRFSTSVLARSTGRAEDQFDLLWGATQYQLTIGSVHKARTTVRHLFRIARSASDKHRILAHVLAGKVELLSGRLLASCFQFARAIELYKPSEHQGLRFEYNADQLALAYVYRAWACAMTGHETAALQDARTALLQARYLDHAFTQTTTMAISGLVHEILNKQVEAQIYTMTSIALANQNDYSYWRAWSEIVRAGSKIVKQAATALDDLAAAGQAYEATGSGQLLSHVYTKSASAYLCNEDVDNAQKSAQKGIRHCELTGISIDLAELHFLVAECHNRRHSRRAMAQHLELALSHARSMRMKPMIERATQAMHQFQ